MIYLFVLIFILFLIGLPFVLAFNWYMKRYRLKNKINFNENEFNLHAPKTIDKVDFAINNNKSVDFCISEFHEEYKKYKFMEDYRMWKNLTNEEKQIRLDDIEVIFNVGTDLIKREMIRKGYPIGSKIIDITYFTGLSEFGSTISTFLIQHENGGEIRALTFNIRLADMNIRATNDRFYSTGKERYHYLKKT